MWTKNIYLCHRNRQRNRRIIEKEMENSAKQTNLMKLEAMALFAGIRAQAATDRWWYFSQRRLLQQPARIDQRISAYRASLFFDYLFCGIECQVYLEREAFMGQLGDDMWSISISGIEGKAHALVVHDHLKVLQEEGFYIPNGNENLERQMNFSLGLYGSCLMHVDVRFPIHQPPLPCALKVLDLLENINKTSSPPMEQLLAQMAAQRNAQQLLDEEDDPDIIMGDWQTWK